MLMSSRSTRESGAVVERPILFAGPMVRPILDGRKLQTRRLASNGDSNCPWGDVGHRLWVRERWGYQNQFADRRAPASGPIVYAADEVSPRAGPWRASYHMPRNACRVVLEITACRTEHLHDLSPDDARAEGYVNDGLFDDPRAWFAHLWDGLHAARGAGWRENPRVWVVSFQSVLVKQCKAAHAR